MIHPSTVLVEIPWSTITDKNGNAAHTENLGKDGWYNLAVSGMTTGNAYWVLSKNLSFLRPAYGSQVHMPVGITAPGSRVDITITGGPANASVSGLIYGQRALRPSYLTDIGGLDDYATNTQLGTGQTLLGVISTPGDGLPHSLTFPVQSASTQAVGWAVSFTGSFTIPASLTMKGDVTQSSPVNIPTITGFTFASGVGRWQLPDQNVICTVTDDGTHPTQIFFLAFNFEPIMNVRVGAGDPAIPVTTANSNAPPWFAANQAPIDIALSAFASGNTQSLLSVSGGVFVRLWVWCMTFDSSASCTLQIQDSGGTSRGSMDPSNNGPICYPFFGSILPLNTGVQLHHSGGATITNARGMLAYSTGTF